MKASIRIHSLTLSGSGQKSLSSMEKHGLREDKTSQARRLRDAEPLVHGGLHLRELFDEHTDGCRRNKGLKRPAMHAIVQFPKELPITPENEQKMLSTAVDFIDSTHGGQAVFAARLDRDEQGRHTVDVFYSPKYTKTTKSKGDEVWISTSRHGKELCQKHRSEIERRHNSKFSTGPRQVGIAMQAELHDYLSKKGLKLEQRTEKKNSVPDRLEPEAFKDYRDAIAKAGVIKQKGQDYIQKKRAESAQMIKTARRQARTIEDQAHKRAEKLFRAPLALFKRLRSAEVEKAVEEAVEPLQAEKTQLQLKNREVQKELRDTRTNLHAVRSSVGELSMQKRELEQLLDQDDHDPEITRSPSR